MRHLKLYEGWLKNLIQPSKKTIPERVYADSFLEGGMEDPMDPESNFMRDPRSLNSQSVKENIPLIIDVSKYYYFDSPFNGTTWLQQFVYSDLWWAMNGISDSSKSLSLGDGRQYYGLNNENAYERRFWLSDNEKEPIVVIISSYGRTGYGNGILQIWIPKSILNEHFKTWEDAQKYANEIRIFAQISKKFPGMTWPDLKSPEKMAELLKDDIILLSDFYDLLDPEVFKSLIKIMGLEMNYIESINLFKDLGLL
jgi:hypothetical protein